jgi:hypothetical protein|tara:strand:+ start:551 stop:736 length:186 start_codon:yes stop_codon:yes gene_type:complete
MKIESNPVVTVEELAVSNMFEIQALLKVLVKKGIICEDEILDEIHQLKEEQLEKRKQIGQA